MKKDHLRNEFSHEHYEIVIADNGPGLAEPGSFHAFTTKSDGMGLRPLFVVQSSKIMAVVSQRAMHMY